MKFVTFNIRCDFGQDGANNFIYRRPLILEKIRQEKPDIIGFQEVLPHVAAWLKENLTEYYIAGCGREKDLTGEAMIIAYRKERFQSVSLETFWLSPTPYVPGSRYPVQSMCWNCMMNSLREAPPSTDRRSIESPTSCSMARSTS